MPTDLVDREFEDLATLLREDRPEADPFFVRELDAKVAAGFPREPRWRRLFTANPLLVPGVAASVLLAVILGAALLSSGPSNLSGLADTDMQEMSAPAPGSAGGAGGSAESAPEALEDEAAQQYSREERRAKGGPEPADAAGSASLVPSAARPGPGGGSPRSDAKQGRKVERSAALVLAAKPGGVQRVHDDVIEVTDQHDGFVMSSSVDVLDGGGGARLELRVPSDRLKPALADLSRIANADVRERSEAAQDITREFVSARTRLAEARADRRGLLRRLERAATDAEREAIKFRIREVNARIAAARTDLARVNNRAGYSNIAVTVVGDPVATAKEDDGVWSPGDAAGDAVRVLEVAAGVLLIALALAVPLALIGGLALVLARLTQRRRRERLLDAV